MPTDKMDFKKIRSAFFLGLIILLGLVTMYIFRPFVYPIFWAAVLAILFYPLYKKINKYLKMPGVSSALTLVSVVALVVIPLTLLIFLIVNESAEVYEKVTTNELFTIQSVTTQLENLPVIGPYIQTFQTQGPELVQKSAKAISSFLFENLKSFTQLSFRFIFMLFIMLYSLFYFLKDGKKFLHQLMHLSPLGDEYEQLLYERFTSTARATLKGTIIIGTIQGTIGGILFWLTGIEGAFIWGALMTALSIIPGVGAGLIWLPAGIIMLALGHFGQGLAILLVGLFVISLIDNLLRPPLVGRDTQMHPLLILFSTLGGIVVFGISGFIIGPVMTALFLAVVSIYDHYYERELMNN